MRRSTRIARENSYFHGPFPKDFVLTYEIAHAILSYDPETGIFRWKMKAAANQNYVKPGMIAGYGQETGWKIKIKGQYYVGGRLAWFMMTGKWPNPEVDHKDCDPNNNRWDNLRESTRQQNGANRRLQKNNTTGRKGVCRVTGKSDKWYSQITVMGKRRTIGFYDCPAAAQLSYLVEANKAFGMYARGG